MTSTTTTVAVAAVPHVYVTDVGENDGAGVLKVKGVGLDVNADGVGWRVVEV